MTQNANLDIVRAPAPSINPIACAPNPRKISAKNGIEIFRTSIMETIFVVAVLVSIAWRVRVRLWARGFAVDIIWAILYAGALIGYDQRR